MEIGLNGYEPIAIIPQYSGEATLNHYIVVVDRGKTPGEFNPGYERYVVARTKDLTAWEWDHSIRYTTSLETALRRAYQYAVMDGTPCANEGAAR